MGRSILLKTFLLSLFTVAIIFVSCSGNDDNSFKKGREVYMSNSVAFQIVFPEKQDTILYRDTLSGFTAWVQNNELHLQAISVKKDSMILSDKIKHEISFEVSFKDSYLRTELNDRRELGSGGDAAVWIDSKKIPLKFSSLKGYLENANSIYLYSEMIPEEQKPYIVMRLKGIRIYE